MGTRRCAGVLAVVICLGLHGGAAFAAGPDEERPTGLRGTLVGQGLMASTGFSYGANEAFAAALHTLDLPALELLLPTGSGEWMIGVGGDWSEKRYEDAAEGDSVESTITMWYATVRFGYAWDMYRAGPNAVRFGGRIGTAFGRWTWASDYSECYGEGCYGSSDEYHQPGWSLLLSAFIAGEYLLFEHFGLQGEVGLSYVAINPSDPDRGGDDYYDEGDWPDTLRYSWLSPYSALSAVVRF